MNGKRRRHINELILRVLVVTRPLIFLEIVAAKGRPFPSRALYFNESGKQSTSHAKLTAKTQQRESCIACDNTGFVMIVSEK